MAQTATARKKAKGAAPTKASTPRAPRVRRVRIEDLHDPALDPKGRVDVLVARSIKLLVKTTPNPVVQTLYGELQPVLDAEIQRLLGGFNIGGLVKAAVQGAGKGKGKRP